VGDIISFKVTPMPLAQLPLLEYFTITLAMIYGSGSLFVLQALDE